MEDVAIDDALDRSQSDGQRQLDLTPNDGKRVAALMATSSQKKIGTTKKSLALNRDEGCQTVTT